MGVELLVQGRWSPSTRLKPMTKWPKLYMTVSTRLTKCITNNVKDPSGNSGSPYWIGARQHCTSCPFEWTDHSPFDYAFWAPGEPNNWGNGEDCVEMTLWDKTWNDDNCNTAFPFICQSYLEGILLKRRVMTW